MRKRLPLFVVVCLIFLHNRSVAQDTTSAVKTNLTISPAGLPGGQCTISGPTTVVAQDNDTYTYSCGVSGVDWFATGGEVTSVSGSSVTVHWGVDLAS